DHSKVEIPSLNVKKYVLDGKLLLNALSYSFLIISGGTLLCYKKKRFRSAKLIISSVAPYEDYFSSIDDIRQYGNRYYINSTGTCNLKDIQPLWIPSLRKTGQIEKKLISKNVRMFSRLHIGISISILENFENSLSAWSDNLLIVKLKACVSSRYIITARLGDNAIVFKTKSQTGFKDRAI
ncbi:15487_t:CDS:2, partial [Funneliformis mosseae]